MTKEEYQNAIKDCDKKIEKLEQEREILISDMNNNFKISLKEKLDNVLRYGKEDGYIILSDHPLVEYYYGNRNRYETIDVSMMIESILDSHQCETLEDQNEVEDIFDYPKISKEDFQRRVENKWARIAKKEDFISLAEGIVKEGYSSFKFDW